MSEPTPPSQVADIGFKAFEMSVQTAVVTPQFRTSVPMKAPRETTKMNSPIHTANQSSLMPLAFSSIQLWSPFPNE